MSSGLNRANLDRELARRCWTANDLAVASGVSAATISSARHGRPLRHKTLHKIANALVNAPIVVGVDVLLETSIPNGAVTTAR
jgi:DNA-binding Xre family transcriptional regulator